MPATLRENGWLRLRLTWNCDVLSCAVLCAVLVTTLSVSPVDCEKRLSTINFVAA